MYSLAKDGSMGSTEEGLILHAQERFRTAERRGQLP